MYTHIHMYTHMYIYIYIYIYTYYARIKMARAAQPRRSYEVRGHGSKPSVEGLAEYGLETSSRCLGSNKAYRRPRVTGTCVKTNRRVRFHRTRDFKQCYSVNPISDLFYSILQNREFASIVDEICSRYSADLSSSLQQAIAIRGSECHIYYI